ncbi:MAG: Rieske family ferredoxin [Pirellulaceae bacterium]|nr:MAG: Rieske family ferredoxin [Pirellulaceae bacterium]
MSDYVEVCSVDDIPDPGKRTVEIDEQFVVVFHVNGQFYCLDDVCTHDGGPLGEGSLEGFAIRCPRHGAQFDIRTGKALTMPATVDTRRHDVKVENGKVFVRLSR